jgi:hypothetical protein
MKFLLTLRSNGWAKVCFDGPAILLPLILVLSSIFTTDSDTLVQQPWIHDFAS